MNTKLNPMDVLPPSPQVPSSAVMVRAENEPLHADYSSAHTAAVEVGSDQPAENEKPPLIDVKEFAAKLSCCPNHVRRMADSGRCPPPIHLGGLHRWNRQVVDDWIAAGCPVVRQVRMSGRKK
jgi:predicted DNA-binding transcriptional regulator AlpA